LGHLDLEVVGAGEVFAGDPEPAARHLLDCRTTVVVEPLGVFATLARVRLATDRVHRNSKGFVRLLADGAVAHCARREPLDDGAHWLDFIERHRRPNPGAQLEQPAQRHQLARLVVDELAVVLENLVAAGAG